MKLRLQAGNPNDANRDYVPLAIPGSDMTVNENGNNSQVYPARLQECTGVLADGLSDRWYEYVPASYDGSKAVPLVVSNHGGLMNGWAQAVYSSWTLLAEREGFICLFPDCHELQMWNLQGMAEKMSKIPGLTLPIPQEPEDYHDNHDLNYLVALIAHIQKKYNIDSSRIYMQGMSMGHMMTDQFARYYGNLLAGAAGSGSSAMENQLYTPDGALRNWGGPVPIWISHPEKNGDDLEEEARAQKAGREYCEKINGVYAPPQIRIQGEDYFAFYSGDKADLVYLDIKNREHGRALDEAFYYWDYLFSGVRRAEDGSLVRQAPRKEPVGDAFALAFTPDTRKAWFRNKAEEMPVAVHLWQKLKYHGLNGGQMVRGEYLCVSLRFLAKVFGAEYRTTTDGLEATLHLEDGRVAQFARGVIGCLVDDELYAMYCETLHRNGELLVSVEWFCRFFFNLHVSTCNRVVYVTDHHAELSYFMAEILKEQLL